MTHPSALLAVGSLAWRISAPEAERIVVDRLKSWLNDRSAILTMVGAGVAASAFAGAQQAATDLGEPGRRLPLIEQLISKIDIGQDRITLMLDPTGVQQLLGIDQLPSDDAIHLTTHTIRIRQGKDVRIIVRDEQDRSTGTVNQPLVALIAEAHEVHQALLAEPDHSIASLAASLGKCRKRAAQLLRIAMLAPDIVARCIAGTQPISLTTRALLNTDLPISWQQQRAMLGFF